jgi:Tfp pilus assembly protein PilW
MKKQVFQPRNALPYQRRGNPAPRPRVARRGGLTLTELLIASTIITMLAAGMGTLVMAVHATNEYCRGQAVAAQHARVTLDRFGRAVRQAHASGQFPGCIVISESEGGEDFPDCLVVWSPTGAAADPAGLPRINELTIYCPDPKKPSRLVELRDPIRTTVCPPITDESGWAALVAGIKASPSATFVELTDRLRTASASGGGSGNLCGCVRFDVLMSPSASDWSRYKSGNLAWKAMGWPLDYYSTQTGMRRVVCQTELQILPGDSAAGETAVPFFGSAILTYELTR